MMVRIESEKCLAEFVNSRSEEAFRKLGGEHSGLVLGATMRRLGGDRIAAEDVMQEVFVLLAKKASELVKGKVSVSGWLYRQSCRLAANRVRGEVRRRRREESFGSGKDDGVEAKNEMTVKVDEALLRLNEEERGFVLARYVEEQDYEKIGQRVGISGEAARKRVGRAVEKLGAILERSGVRVSASALAVILVGVGGPRALAELVGSVGAAGGIFSVAGILAGAMGVSVVMGGVRLLDGEQIEKEEVAKSQRTTPNREGVLWRIQMAKANGRSMSDAEIHEHLIALDGEPVSLVTDLMLEQVLESVDGERFFVFVDWAEENVSVRMRERLYFSLVGRAMEHDPAGTLEKMMAKGIFRMTEFGVGSSGMLGVKAFMGWSGLSFEEALRWFKEHWDEIDALGRKSAYWEMENARRRKGPFQRANIDTVADQIGQSLGLRVFASDGFDGIERFVVDLDDQSKVAVWKYVFLLVPKRGELYPREFADYLRRFPDYEPYGELKEVSWLRWYQFGRTKGDDGRIMTKAEYMKALPPGLGLEFKKSCLDEIKRDGEGGEE